MPEKPFDINFEIPPGKFGTAVIYLLVQNLALQHTIKDMLSQINGTEEKQSPETLNKNFKEFLKTNTRDVWADVWGKFGE